MGASLQFLRGDEVIRMGEMPSLTYSNCIAVLRALGFDPATSKFQAFDVSMENFDQFSGSVKDLLEACQLYMRADAGSILDNGTETVRKGGLIAFGRRAGYITERINQFLTLSEVALKRGADKFVFA